MNLQAEGADHHLCAARGAARSLGLGAPMLELAGAVQAVLFPDRLGLSSATTTGYSTLRVP